MYTLFVWDDLSGKDEPMTFVGLCIVALGGDALWNLFLLWRNIRYYQNLRERGIPESLKRFFSQGYQVSHEIAYALHSLRLSFFSQAAGFFLLGGFLFFGGLGVLCSWGVRVGGSGWVGSLLCFGVFVVGSALLRLPLDVYHDFVLEVRHGFGTGNIKVFAGDRLKSLGIQMLVMLPLFAALVSLTSLHYWYLWGAAVSVAVLLLFSYIAPQWILPLFYTLKPLENASVQEKIEALLDKASLKCEGVFVGDESQRSHHANAMVLGLGKAKKILLFDTLLKKMEEPELLAITAHEIGHAVHGHIRKRLFWGVLSMVLLFGFMGVLWELPLPMDAGGTAATVQGKFLLLFLTASAGGSLISGLLSPLYRREEFEADAYGANLAGRSAMMGALRKLATGELHWIGGDPLYRRWKHTHPTISERLQRLEAEGESPEREVFEDS